MRLFCSHREEIIWSQYAIWPFLFRWASLVLFGNELQFYDVIMLDCIQQETLLNCIFVHEANTTMIPEIPFTQII